MKETRVFAVHTPESVVLDVVFIHGLDGDAYKTWSQEGPESFWPKWLGADLEGVAIWTVDYPARSSRWRGHSMPMQDRAINLMAQLKNCGIGERPLCFVTHSMGGLLAKEILLYAADGRTVFTPFAEKIKGVVFFATPHVGAGLAKVVKALGFLYRGSPAVDGLKPRDPYLRRLNERYRDWVDEVKLRHLVFFETRRTKRARVVDETSANPGLAGFPAIGVDANHVDICKPADRESLVYGQVKRFITTVRNSLSQRGPARPAGEPVSWLPPLIGSAVPRPDLAELLIRRLTDDDPASAAGVTTVHGGGGYGKTTLCAMVCRDDRIQTHFTDGILSIDVGPDAAGDVLAEKINGLIELLTGQRPGYTDVMQAGYRLGELIGDRRLLLVVDDVWNSAQLTPLLQGSGNVRRLVTTRDRTVLPADCSVLTVEALDEVQAVALLTGRVPDLPPADARRLTSRCGHWPILLDLVGGFLRAELDRDATMSEACYAVERGLAVAGPIAFDSEGQRSRAVAATIEASLDRLGDPTNSGESTADRYRDLAIFQKGEVIPIEVVTALWSQVTSWNEWHAEQFCRLLADRALVRWVHEGLGLHDILHDYLRHTSEAALAGRHAALLDAHGRGLGGTVERPAWWQLPPIDGYVRRHLHYHLRAAGRADEVAMLIRNRAWIASQLSSVGPTALVADLAAIEADEHAVELARLIRQIGHLVPQHDPPVVIAATVRAYTSGLAGFRDVLTYTSGATEANGLSPVSYPLPDLPDGRLDHTFVDHRHGLWHLLVSADGSWIASATDRTVSIRSMPDGQVTQLVHLDVSSDKVTGLVAAPDDTWIAAAVGDTIRVWDPRTRSERPPLLGHTGEVKRLVLAAGGAWLASGGDDCTIRIWDPVNGAHLTTIDAGRHIDGPLLCASDGAWIAAATFGQGGGVRVWDPIHGVELGVVEASEPIFTKMAAAADGSWLAVAAGNPGEVRIWDAKTRAVRAVLPGHRSRISELAAAPDGSWLATSCGYGDDHTVLIWDTARWELLDRFDAQGRTGQLVVAPDSSWLACTGGQHTAGGHPVEVWHRPTRRRLLLAASTLEVSSMAGSPDSSLLAAGAVDGTVHVWDVHDGRHVGRVDGHVDRVGHLAWSPDGSWLASGSGPGSGDGTVRVWSLDRISQHPTRPATAPIGCLVTPRDRSWLAAAGSDRRYFGFHAGQLTIWETQDDAAPTISYRPDGLAATRLLAAADGSWLAGMTDAFGGATGVWSLDLTTEPPQVVIADDALQVRVIAAGPGDAWLAAGGGRDHDLPNDDVSVNLSHGMRLDRPGDIWVWNPRTGARLATQSAHRAPVTQLAVAPDGSWLASASSFLSFGPSGDDTYDGDIHIWTPTDCQPLAVLSGPWSTVKRLLAAPDSSWLAATVGGSPRRLTAEDPTVRLWEPRSGTALPDLVGHRGAVHKLAVTPDSTRLISVGRDGTIRLWNPRTGTCHGVLDHPKVASLAIEPEGKWFASTGDDGTIRTWDTITGKQYAEVPPYKDRRSRTWISPDSSRLATVGEDGLIQIWNPRDGTAIAGIRVGGALFDCAWLHNSSRLAVAGIHGLYAFDL